MDSSASSGTSIQPTTQQLQYPLLAPCRVELTNGAAAAAGRGDPQQQQPGLAQPIRLPADCYRLAQEPLPTAYDFALERQLVQAHQDRKEEWELYSCTTKEPLVERTIERMQSITRANFSTCKSLLEQHGYDVQRSVEAYYRK